MPYETTPDVCPKCGKGEDARVVCHHCGYEYPEDDMSLTGPEKAVVAIIIVVVIWVVLTLIGWLAVTMADDGGTLMDVLRGQVEFMKRWRIK
jgi:uncharacterized protein (DUF983 family)